MTTCTRCHRTLRSAASQARQMGPTCARRIRSAATTIEAKPETLAKALEDLDDGAVVDTNRRTSTGRRIFAVLSSTGTGIYLATAGACTCRAGLKGRTCRHTTAAALLAA